MKSNRFIHFLPVVIVLMALAGDALAGGAGGQFIQPLSTFLIDSLKGYVGTTIGIGGLLYGLIAGIGKGSLSGLGLGIGLAAASYYGPDIIQALSGVTVTSLQYL